MIIDLNKIKKIEGVKKYDVCISGAGPAGITIARYLSAKGKSVALLEGGSEHFSEESQDSYDGNSIGLEYYQGLKYNRLRFLGGTSNHWAGRCSFFDDIDFEQRPYFNLPGWPIKRDELFKYFNDAMQIVDIDKQGFANSQKNKWHGQNFRFSEYTLSSPTRFGTKYYKELKDSNNIDLFINANLTNIKLVDNHNHVLEFQAQNYNKNFFVFNANNYVLAMGAIENARLLLNNDKQLKTGIGNHSDMVGRCFMEHLNIQLGRFVAEDHLIWKSGGFQLNPNPDFIKKLNIGNSVISFDIPNEIKSYGRLAKLKSNLQNFLCKTDLTRNISRQIVDFDCLGDGLITTLMEQAPNVNSRVKLGIERDHFDLRRVTLDWKLSEKDLETIHVLGIEVAKEVAKTRVARVKLHDYIVNKNMPIRDVGAHAHHLGTTRMSKNPKYGVVNENLRVHNIKNMYVAGSSVFPTGGGCNPTLSLVMLSIRLADYLSQS